MKSKTVLLSLIIIALTALQFGMARHGEYDEEAREEARLAKEVAKQDKESGEAYRPVRGIASGVKEAAVDSTAGFLEETAEATREEPPLVGTLEGARLGSGEVLDKALKGTVKVATLGYGDLQSYDVVEPEAGSGEPTKVRIKIPGT